MKVVVNIKELVLHGVPARDGRRISEATRGELSRLLAEQGVPATLHAGRDQARLDGGPVEIRRGAGAQAIGVEVARAVDRGWRP